MTPKHYGKCNWSGSKLGKKVQPPLEPECISMRVRDLEIWDHNDATTQSWRATMDARGFRQDS